MRGERTIERVAALTSAGPAGAVSPAPIPMFASGAAAGPSLRLALALGDPERERELLPALHESGDFTVTERCLAAGQLLDCVRASRVDAALVAYDLHRLGREQLAALTRTGVAVLLFTPPDAVDEARRDIERIASSRARVVVVALGTAPGVVRLALAAAVRGESWVPPVPTQPTEVAGVAVPQAAPVAPPPTDVDGDTRRVAPGVPCPAEVEQAATAASRAVASDVPCSLGSAGEAREAPVAVLPSLWPASLSVIAVGSGHGSAGRTTIALNLAVALGAVAPTILVDLDLAAPAVATHLDADPTRNVYMLAHGEPESPREWERALEQETQPLAARSPHGRVLCGVPKPEMRGGLSARFVERLIAELRQRYQYVIVDVGAFSQSPETAPHGVQSALFAQAGQVVLVAAADLVGLARARTALAAYQGYPGATLERVVLVVNRHDRHYHYSRSDIEWALGVGAAAIVPFDHGGVERALAAQRPLVLDGRSRAARAIMELADRLHGGSVLLPPEPSVEGHSLWTPGAVAGFLWQRPLDAVRRLWPLRAAPSAQFNSRARQTYQGVAQEEAAAEARPEESGEPAMLTGAAGSTSTNDTAAGECGDHRRAA